MAKEAVRDNALHERENQMLTEQANELDDFIDEIKYRLLQKEIIDEKALCAIEAMAVLYGTAMAYDPLNPSWAYRDRLFYYKASANTALQAYSIMRDQFDDDIHEDGGYTRRYQSSISGCTFDNSCEGICEAIRSTVGHANHNPYSYTFLVVDGSDIWNDGFWEGVVCAHYLGLDRLIMIVITDIYQEKSRTIIRFKDNGWDINECRYQDIRSIKEAVGQSKKTEGLPSVVIIS